MKNKKVIKIIVFILIILGIGLLLSNTVYGWNVNDQLDKFDKASENSGNAGIRVTNIMGAAINITSTVAAGVAIIMLVVIGIQYVSSGADGKAEAKKDLTGYVIGAVILFGASGILKILQMFIDKNVNDI